MNDVKNIDTSNMAPDDVVRHWGAEAQINFDDDRFDAGEGGFIALLAVVLFVLIAIGSFVAVVLS